MKPANETELAEAVKTAAARKTRLRIQGGGSKTGVGNRTDADETLDVTALSGISLYEPGALTLVAGAGTPLTEVQSTLAAENQQLAFEPMDYAALLGNNGAPTVGGIAACNTSGPRRIQGGACRDSMIGIRMVDGSGEVIKNGGRVMKNVTGYDLVKLVAGAYGTLGVLTEVAFKVLPKPEMIATVSVDVSDDKTAIAALSAALGSPYDVTAAAYIPNTGAMVRLEGFSDMIAHRSERLKEVLGGFGEVHIETNAAKVNAGWTAVREVESLQGLDTDLWRISVKPSDGPKVATALADGLDRSVYDWGGGLIWASVQNGFDVRSKLTGIQGYAQCLRGDADFFPTPDAITARIEAGLRKKFDPHGILNAGIMG